MNTSVILSLCASLISGVGTALTLLALPFLIDQAYHSPMVVSYYMSASIAICFIATPLISLLIDHWSTKKVAFLIGTSGCLMQLGMFILFLNQASGISFIICGIVSTLLRAAEQINRTAIIKHYLPFEQYQWGNKYLEVLRQGIPTTASIFGIALFNYTEDISLIILLDSISFLIFAILSSLMHEKNGSLDHMLRKTFSFKSILSQMSFFNFSHDGSTKKIRSNRFYYLALAPYITIMSILSLLPVYVSQSSTPSLKTMSLFFLLYGAGGIIGGYFGGRWSALKSIERCQLFFCLFLFIMMGCQSTILMTATCLGFLAFIHAAVRVQRSTMIMEVVTSHYVARITGYFEMVSVAFIVLTTLAVGFLARYSILHALSFLLFMNLVVLYVLLKWKIPRPRMRMRG